MIWRCINWSWFFNCKLLICIYYKWSFGELFVVNIVFLNSPEHICLHTLKWFQVLLFNTNNFIWPINGVLIGSTTPSQSGHQSSGHWRCNQHYRKFRDFWNLNFISILVSLLGHSLVGEGFYSSAKMKLAYSTGRERQWQRKKRQRMRDKFI